MTILWDPSSAKSRLEALQEYLESHAGRSGASELAADIAQAIAGGKAAELQRELALSFRRLVMGSPPFPVSLAWYSYQELQKGIHEFAKAYPDVVSLDDPSIELTVTNKMGNVALNIEQLHNALEARARARQPADIFVLHAAMSGIIQTWELMKIVQTSHAIQNLWQRKKKDVHWQAAKPAAWSGLDAAQNALWKFVNLRWFAQVPEDLARIRHAWAHGDAHFEGERLVVQDSGTTLDLTLRQLATFLVAGRYAWEAFLIDAMFIGCVAKRP